MDRTDGVLLAAYLLVAVLGTCTQCLLVSDGAIYLAAAWLGNACDLFFDQNTARAPHDERDRLFPVFLDENYCVR
jgi:hypothetical protein